MSKAAQVAVIGAGNIGIAVAYYLKKLSPSTRVLLLERGQPMAFTSAQSGENYRNWWPSPCMRAFTNHSIDLMEEIAEETDNRIQLNRRGYALTTRSTDISAHLDEFSGFGEGNGENDQGFIRIHSEHSEHYVPPNSDDWRTAPSGVDVLSNPNLIQKNFTSFDKSVKHVIHIRRAGMLSGQQLGDHMLDYFKRNGGERKTGHVEHVSKSADGFCLGLQDGTELEVDQVVNAAGPFLGEIASQVGVDLNVSNWLQQKIAFDDHKGVVPQDMPFSIDLDSQMLDWEDDEREMLQDDPEYEWLTWELPGGAHCRPEGATWLKLGWAYNASQTKATFEPEFHDNFPEIVLRGAARLNPGLKAYYGQLPRAMSHYGGFYTLTDENWPLIGHTRVPEFYVAGALSGFGTMAACATGQLTAQCVLGLARPSYAKMLSPLRYDDPAAMEEIKKQSGMGIL